MRRCSKKLFADIRQIRLEAQDVRYISGVAGSFALEAESSARNGRCAMAKVSLAYAREAVKAARIIGRRAAKRLVRTRGY